jgi:hypothetical protein
MVAEERSKGHFRIFEMRQAAREWFGVFSRC